jgi:hypothetical protein
LERQKERQTETNKAANSFTRKQRKKHIIRGTETMKKERKTKERKNGKKFHL